MRGGGRLGRGDEGGEHPRERQRAVRPPLFLSPTSARARTQTLTDGRARCRSAELFAALRAVRDDPATKGAVLDVRGQGLMVAVEFASPTGTGPYDSFRNPSVPEKLASRVAKKCVEKGLLILTTSVYEVIRFIPALNVSQADLAKGCKIFAEAVEEVVREG